MRTGTLNSGNNHMKIDGKITKPLDDEEVNHLETIEALFFAYRDFVSDPDRILSQYKLGRAHHRVLYFANRYPGMTVAEMLEILQITKQSLARVLKQLIETDLIVQSEGEVDRRKRLLYPTEKGRELVLALSNPQSRRISGALSNLDAIETKAVNKFLKSMGVGPL